MCSYFYQKITEVNLVNNSAIIDLTFPDPPFAPNNFRVTSYNPDSISVAWEKPEHDGGAAIQRYVIEKRDALMSMWTQAGVVDKEVTEYTVDKLFEGQNYFFRVAAENECGRGHYAETDRPTQAKLPYGE